MRKIIFICLILFFTAGCNSNSEKEKGTIQKNDSKLNNISSISEKEMDTMQQIDLKLNTIVTSTEFKQSSNPYDYLKAHSDEFDYIVSKKEIALNHFLDKFANSQKDGLEEYIMATACVKILGEKNPIKEWSSGREWYGKYSSEK